MSRIRFTPHADRDFIEIYVYVASDNISAADKHHERLRQRCLELVDQPRIGTKRDEIKPGRSGATKRTSGTQLGIRPPRSLTCLLRYRKMLEP